MESSSGSEVLSQATLRLQGIDLLVHRYNRSTFIKRPVFDKPVVLASIQGKSVSPISESEVRKNNNLRDEMEAVELCCLCVSSRKCGREDA